MSVFYVSDTNIVNNAMS